MSTVLASPRLPWELMDAIVDHLQADLPMLATCGMVSTECVKRSRHHIFSTVQLWPWRVRNFIELARSKSCTFSKHIHRIELDDSRIRPGRPPGVQFTEAMSLSHLSRLSQVQSIQVRSVDWTALSPTEQLHLRHRLSRFKLLKCLEFDDVVFHDLREVVNIVTSFPLLKHLSANVSFMKYTEHAVASAANIRLPKTVETLELGTDDGVPVVMSSVLAHSDDPHVTRLHLRNLKVEHLPLLRTTVRQVGGHLRHVLLGLESSNFNNADQDNLIQNLKLSRLSQLRTLYIEGLELSQKRGVCEMTLPHLLSRLESPFLQKLTVSFKLEYFEDLDNFHWNDLQRVLKELHFFGLKNILVKVQLLGCIAESYDTSGSTVEHWLRKALKDLDTSGVLEVMVFPSC